MPLANAAVATFTDLGGQFRANAYSAVIDYAAFFNRPADACGRAFWVNACVRGIDLTTIAAAFITSLEYTALHPGNLDFVQSLSQDVLGQPAGAQAGFFNAMLDNCARNRTDLAFIFLTSDEAYINGISNLYGEILGRPVDGRTLQALLSPAAAGTITPTLLASLLLGSDEYLIRQITLACLNLGP